MFNRFLFFKNKKKELNINWLCGKWSRFWVAFEYPEQICLLGVVLKFCFKYYFTCVCVCECVFPHPMNCPLSWINSHILIIICRNFLLSFKIYCKISISILISRYSLHHHMLLHVWDVVMFSVLFYFPKLMMVKCFSGCIYLNRIL